MATEPIRLANRAVEAAKQAARHHTTLCQFEVIASLALGSDIDSTASRIGARIAALCRAEQKRQLRRMDNELSKVATKRNTQGERNGD